MATETRPKFCVLIHNITKPRNFGMILRSAAAFNVHKVILVSRHFHRQKKSRILKEFGLFFGDKGCANKISYEVFHSLSEAKQSFGERGLTVCGVEIAAGALPVHAQPFRGDTVFVLGNEGEGIIEPVRQICDHFVFIAQYTTATASLNVAVSASIVFHHFALWAQYPVARFEGEKFRRGAEESRAHRPTFEIAGGEAEGDGGTPAEDVEVGWLFDSAGQ